MVLRVKENLTIENLGHCSAEAVEKLRKVLHAGAQARVDSRRKDFYEVQNGSRVFWIHVSPVNGNVVLLASWEKPVSGSTKLAPQAA